MVLLPRQPFPGARRCPACGKSKPLSEWPRDAGRVGGYHSRCKACHRLDADARRARLREHKHVQHQALVAADLAAGRVKRCFACGQERALCLFSLSNNPKYPDGRWYRCKPCESVRRKPYDRRRAQLQILARALRVVSDAAWHAQDAEVWRDVSWVDLVYRTGVPGVE